jgi:hypothetical protein
MPKPIKVAEKAVTVAAGVAWNVFNALNSIRPNASFTPKWSEKPLLKSWAEIVGKTEAATGLATLHRFALSQVRPGDA